MFRVDVEGVLVVSISEFRVYGLGRLGILTLGSLGYGGIAPFKRCASASKVHYCRAVENSDWELRVLEQHLEGRGT